MLRDHDEADEVTQRTFIQVYRKIGGFEGRSALRTWVLRIAVNQAKNLLRGGGRRGEMPGEDRLPDPAPSADERIDGARRWGRVVRAAATLPNLQRAVLTLRARQGLSYEEIAGIVGCSAGSAKVNYHHAVKKLRRMLVGEAG
jgi:RNA polymerase sigma-70 factor (ECF subfamily)